ncbi:hypothetical protein KQX54_008592 [Cotesia glomerata]|uniref:Uncharacterized protein n=1 Tax=Cotesia glomerata TaxID=32391 RepID=A0AAV7HZ10_COTGL|nr:hypothetical protein KQX54_008592 [Cotesia glomerata]
MDCVARDPNSLRLFQGMNGKIDSAGTHKVPAESLYQLISTHTAYDNIGYSDISLLAEAESNNRNTDEENEDQQDHQDRQEQFQPTTICETLNAITVLQKFVAFDNQFNTDDTLTTMKRKIQNIFETQLTKKQTKMTDYFKN